MQRVDGRLCALGWFTAGVLAWPHMIVAYDWAVSEWERRHRPTWPPTEST